MNLKVQEVLGYPHRAGVYGLVPDIQIESLTELIDFYEYRLFWIDGKNITTKSAFFDEIEKVLEFPYFGRNWDALADCLSDLSWLSDKGYVLYYKNADELFESGSEEIYKTINVMQDAIQIRIELIPEIPLYIFFQGSITILSRILNILI